jgi:two-component system, NarL family, invasion response regulator UvrY
VNSESRQIRVLLADDHAVFREGLRLILEKDLPGAVIGGAQTAADTLAQVRIGQWDILVLDLAMPGKSGLDILLEVKALAPNLRVLVLSMYPEKQFAARALMAGADAYLSKDVGRVELLRAIRSVLAGKRYVSSRFAETVANGLAGNPEQPLHAQLSGREFEVMRAIALGRTLTEIARDCSISPHTVTTYRERILKKMELRTNADLTRYAVENALI